MTPTPTPTPTPTAEPTASPTPTPTPAPPGIYFPPPGQTLDQQNQKLPEAVGLHPDIVGQLDGRASRWAIWRHGYLVHLSGGFNARSEVKSLRKTWHALTVGAAIAQGKIPSYNQALSVWETDLTGKDATATWWHVMTQSAAFDYPGCGDATDYDPGQMWTYSDLNPYRLNNALAKAYGKASYYDNYAEVIAQAYFDAIGMSGWSVIARDDGIRFGFDLEDMGRLGLLMVARGSWAGQEVIPAWFVTEQERQQTQGMAVNYHGCNNGTINLSPAEFPESPYGFMTWTNSAGNYYPGAGSDWAWGWGAGGYYLLWNQTNGIVYAAVGVGTVDTEPTSFGIPHIIEQNITGGNPLVE